MERIIISVERRKDRKKDRKKERKKEKLVECWLTETVGLLGTGAQDGHLDFHTAPEL